MKAPLQNEPDWRRDFEFYRYGLPMRGGGRREGILLHLRASDFHTGWGDAAPLPGWSVESLEEVRRCIQDSQCKAPVPSSLACAIQSARASISSSRSQDAGSRNLPLNALLDGSFQQMLEQAGDALARGCECLKIKAAHLSVADLLELMSRISALAPDRCRFRIDSNRAWDFETALLMAESLRVFPLEYLEEPLRDSSRLTDFIKISPVGVALDETLREVGPAGLRAYQGAVALVLKPTLMGGFEACAQYAEAGSVLDMVPVVSACYESGVGIYALAQFALSLPHPAAAGLDTYSRLEEDVLCERLDLRDFIFCSKTTLPDVDISKLHPL